MELENVPEEEMSDEFKALSAEERKADLENQFEEVDLNEVGEITSEEVIEHVENAIRELEAQIKNLKLSPSTKSNANSPDSIDQFN